MSDTKSFSSLSAADRWAMTGHLLTALATVAFSIAGLWRTREEGHRLPDHKPLEEATHRSAKDYFS